MSSLSILTLAPLLLFAFIATLLGLWRLTWAYLAAVLGMVIALAVAGAGIFRVLREGELRYYLGGWPPPFGIEYVLDHLSAFMVMIIVFIGLIAVIYPPRAGLYLLPSIK